jgi:hypothetical protein
MQITVELPDDLARHANPVRDALEALDCPLIPRRH